MTLYINLHGTFLCLLEPFPTTDSLVFLKKIAYLFVQVTLESYLLSSRWLWFANGPIWRKIGIILITLHLNVFTGHLARVQIKVYRGPDDHHHHAPYGYWVKQPADDGPHHH